MRKAIMTAVAIVASCGFTFAQKTGADYLKLLTNDIVICDKGEVEFYVDLKLNKNENCKIPYTIYVNGEFQKTVDYIVESGLLDANGQSKEHIKIKVQEPVTLNADPEGKHVHYDFKLGLIHDDGFSEHENIDTLKVDVWGTPKAEIASPDKTDLCGYNHTLEANGRWKDISSYHWSAGKNITLGDVDSRLCQMELNTKTERSETIYLLETTGPNGECRSTDEKTFNFKNTPTASIVATDDEQTKYICEVLSGDPAFDFEGDITLDGNGPFSVTLSNGEQFDGLGIGTTTRQIHVTNSGYLTIKSIADRYGCGAAEGDAKGSIEVIDRTPRIEAPTDTAEIEGREVVITRPMSEMGTDIKFEVTEVFHKHYNNQVKVDNIISEEYYSISGNNAKYHFKTNKTGLIGIEYTEINKMEDHEDCQMTIRQYVNTYAPVNAPNGFSPNIDGKNDYLVIQGIPDENHVAVYDQKGKIIFQQDNYRNDWNAEGVEDGYYVYTFEGEGIKTTKATLVIKRNKK